MSRKCSTTEQAKDKLVHEQSYAGKFCFKKWKKKKKKEAGFGISRGGQAAFSFFSHTAISMANFFNIAMDHYFSLNLFLPFF